MQWTKRYFKVHIIWDWVSDHDQFQMLEKMQEYCNGVTIKDKDYHIISETSASSVHLQLNALVPTVPIQDNHDRQAPSSSVSQELWNLKQCFLPRPQEDQLLKSIKTIKVSEKWSQQRANRRNTVMMQHTHVFPQMNTQLASLFLEKKFKKEEKTDPATCSSTGKPTSMWEGETASSL